MNMKETIRRVLNEEKNSSMLFRRRVPIDELENVFNKSLDKVTEWFYNDYRHSKKKRYRYTLDNFFTVVISLIMDTYHWELHSTTPENHQWHDEVFDFLKNYFNDRIIERWEAINNNLI